MSLVADLSKAWNEMTAAVLKPLGVTGVIAYAGCDFAPKNVGVNRVQDWRANGLMVGLVVENFSDDLKKGAAEGARQGANLRAAAVALGYDLTQFVGYLSADWDVPASLYSTVAAACDAARPHLPVLGLYGPGPLLDWLLDRGHIDVAWNSESLSFGTQCTRAVLWQHYNDPRAAGNPIDCNDVKNTPLRMWGEAQPTPTPAPTPTPKEDPMQAVIHTVGDGPDVTQQWLFVPEAPAYIPVEDDPERNAWIAAGAIVPKGDANGATISGKVHGLLKSKYGVTS